MSFWPQGHNLIKRGRSLLGDVTYHISIFYALWFEEDVFMFSLYNLAYIKHLILGRGQIWLQVASLNELGTSLLGDATRQIPWLCALWFQKRRLFACLLTCKTCGPRGPFLAQGASFEQTL